MENRWSLIIDKYEGVARFGADLLAGSVANYLSYVLPVRFAKDMTEDDLKNQNVIIIGTKKQIPS